MHNLFLVYFVNLYKSQAYLGTSSGGTTVCIQQLVLVILFRCLLSWLDWNNRTYTSVGTYYSFYLTVRCPGWIVQIQPGQRTVI